MRPYPLDAKIAPCCLSEEEFSWAPLGSDAGSELTLGVHPDSVREGWKLADGICCVRCLDSRSVVVSN